MNFRKRISGETPDPCNWNSLHDAFFHTPRHKLLGAKFDCGTNMRGMSFTGKYSIRNGVLWMELTPEVREFSGGGKARDITQQTNFRTARRASMKVEVEQLLESTEEAKAA